MGVQRGTGPAGGRGGEPAGAGRSSLAVAALRLPLATLLLLAALPGCGQDLEPHDGGGSAIAPATFVQILETLSTARAETHPDTALYARRRAEILASHQVTEADLIRFTEVHGRNDELLAPIYQRVGIRLDSLMQERARRTGEPMGTGTPSDLPDLREPMVDPPPELAPHVDVPPVDVPPGNEPTVDEPDAAPDTTPAG